ncbi:hypothetical protein N5C93_18270, partial [Pseudomonas nitroreducens]|uniref:hypothetical protein n=1 Tax=Pseudomonas nitroreducens TaxID=46680 RepID=UPI002447DCCF
TLCEVSYGATRLECHEFQSAKSPTWTVLLPFFRFRLNPCRFTPMRLDSLVPALRVTLMSMLMLPLAKLHLIFNAQVSVQGLQIIRADAQAAKGLMQVLKPPQDHAAQVRRHPFHCSRLRLASRQ